VVSTGGGCYVSYINNATDAACATGFKNKGFAGTWGSYRKAYTDLIGAYDNYFLPPGGSCSSGWGNLNVGETYVCCQN
jgi:hypothetical protein